MPMIVRKLASALGVPRLSPPNRLDPLIGARAFRWPRASKGSLFARPPLKHRKERPQSPFAALCFPTLPCHWLAARCSLSYSRLLSDCSLLCLHDIKYLPFDELFVAQHPYFIRSAVQDGQRGHRNHYINSREPGRKRQFRRTDRTSNDSVILQINDLHFSIVLSDPVR